MRKTWKARLAAALMTVALAFSFVAPINGYAATEKKLYFEESRGKLSYTPVRDPNENWFMSFRAMLPGVTYHDEMKIENHSKKTFDLYMQVIPLKQDVIKDELLKMIWMKVYYQGELFYDGDALGVKYPGKVPEKNLQEVIPLGTYTPGSNGLIQVDVGIPADLIDPEKYNDVLTKVDWRFMVAERVDPTKPTKPGGGGDEDPPKPTKPTSPPTPTQPGEPKSPGGDKELTPLDDGEVPRDNWTLGDPSVPLGNVYPKTGDELPVMPLVLVMLFSGVVIVVLGSRLRKVSREEE